MKNRIGETKIMNCGIEATIIEYRNYQDVDVVFPNHGIKQHVTYGSFSKGAILPPDISYAEYIRNKKFRDHTGETKIMNCGLEATIISYHNSQDIDVLFPGHGIKQHVKYSSFSNGQILPPDITPTEYISKKNFKDRTGETKTMNCGFEATIIKYRNLLDIDVLFPGHGVKQHQRYEDFSKGQMLPPDITQAEYNRIKNLKDHTGETKIMNCGLEATIIKYRNSGDIDVLFPGHGTQQHTSYYRFSNGQILPPDITPTEYISKKNFKDRTGEAKTMKCGIKATIIAYRAEYDIDVQFDNEEKEIRTCTYGLFNARTLVPPSMDPHYYWKNIKENFKKQRIGETRQMRCGINATIIEYRSSRDIDVKFENGEIKKHTSYTSFKRGKIRSENHMKNLRTSETRMMVNGLNATVTDYRSAMDIDIMFEDGAEVKNKKYPHFIKGHIRHPNLHNRYKGFFHGIRITASSPTKIENAVYYKCECSKCGYKDIMTPQMMIEHAKKCGIF